MLTLFFCKVIRNIVFTLIGHVASRFALEIKCQKHYLCGSEKVIIALMLKLLLTPYYKTNIMAPALIVP